MRARSMMMVGSLIVGAAAPALAAGPTALELPREVPAAKITQQIGLTEITVEYDCPAARGRKVFGNVVPYDLPWTIGVNPAARLEVSREVTIGDQVVPAGSYWLLATPGKSSWTFMVNKGAEPVTGARQYKPELDVARVKTAGKSAPRRERLTFLFSDQGDDRVSLDLEWDGVRASLPIQVHTKQQIESALGGLDGTWRSYANAARYMLETKKDYDTGLHYIDASLALQAIDHVQDWYCLWIKGALYAAKGDFAQATALARQSYELASRGGSFALEPDLSKAIDDWDRRAGGPGERRAVAQRAVQPTEPAPPKVEPPALAKVEPTVEIKADVETAPKVEPKPVEARKLEGRADRGVEHTDTVAAPLGDPPLLRRARLRRR
ncbi:MAG TPA: DUF2911 domain-containing protein [Polyangia bacterium]|nr:DUF2911 domain-containing protein [Polyangia bacterium]